ncbi:PAS and ANTAR domain-containing protein [Oerskovia enterophila]|uniref:PAS and ANTAR domain-containing protein n=1 Tax=Oerskovia enterophila TaxID=43678 RepID=UPI0033983BEC
MSETWWWSDGLYRIYGFAPGEIVPTTELMLAHKHPHDRARTTGAFAEIARTGQPFSCMQRIIDATGRTRTVVIVGEARTDHASGRVVWVSGYVTDLTRTQEEVARDLADQDIRASAANRGAIEQAKGALMVVYGLDEDEAFEVLRHQSSLLNEPIRDMAHRLLNQLASGPAGTFPTPEDLDNFFETPPPLSR